MFSLPSSVEVAGSLCCFPLHMTGGTDSSSVASSVWALPPSVFHEGTKETWRLTKPPFCRNLVFKKNIYSRELIYWGVSLVNGKKEKQKYVLIDCPLSNPVLMSLDYSLERYVLVWYNMELLTNFFLPCGQLRSFFLISWNPADLDKSNCFLEVLFLPFMPTCNWIFLLIQNNLW